jgi:teichuronic acid biosynthesis glycosyltransferase TuaC
LVVDSTLRALVVSNMLADAAHPERGRFVRDQVAALRRLDGIEVELYEFAPGKSRLLAAALQLRRLAQGSERFDVVHAHFGLSAWPALAVPARVRALTLHGTDITHRRTRRATLAVLGRIDLLAAVSQPLLEQLPPPLAARAIVLPCGVDMQRFHPLPREQARAALGLDRGGPYLLFPADPARSEKRHDLALRLAARSDTRLLTLGGVEPEQVPLWINAANAVLVPSDREGFGLAALEALACDVPVLATPVGIHPQALRGVSGTLCAPFQLEIWAAALTPHLAEPDPRVQGREAVAGFSSDACAEAVLSAWRTALQHGDRVGTGSE